MGDKGCALASPERKSVSPEKTGIGNGRRLRKRGGERASEGPVRRIFTAPALARFRPYVRPEYKPAPPLRKREENLDWVVKESNI